MQHSLYDVASNTAPTQENDYDMAGFGFVDDSGPKQPVYDVASQGPSGPAQPLYDVASSDSIGSRHVKTGHGKPVATSATPIDAPG